MVPDIDSMWWALVAVGVPVLAPLLAIVVHDLWCPMHGKFRREARWRRGQR